MNKSPITVVVVVKAPLDKVWEYWVNPKYIVHWAHAIDEWECPAAERDLRVGGKFKTSMAAKDKSASFDITGFFTAVEEKKLIEYDMSNGRHVREEFIETPEGVKVSVTFDPESINSEEKQREGWQGISNNFKKFVENN